MDAPKVGIIMGSSSDAAVMHGAATILDSLEIPHEDQIVSAHRTPTRLAEYTKHAEDIDLKVIIAGAGGAAHLPGMIASHTVIPVVGVPIMIYNNKDLNAPGMVPLSAFGGLDSLLSITEMPTGSPVASMGINKSKNAGLYAAKILASHDKNIYNALKALKSTQYNSVVKESDMLYRVGLSDFVNNH